MHIGQVVNSIFDKELMSLVTSLKRLKNTNKITTVNNPWRKTEGYVVMRSLRTDKG